MGSFYIINKIKNNLKLMEGNEHNKIPPNYDTNKHATNTFSQSPSCPQILAYIIIVGSIIIFYACIHHLLNNWILFGLYTFFTLLFLTFYCLASCSDPTDRTVY